MELRDARVECDSATSELASLKVGQCWHAFAVTGSSLQWKLTVSSQANLSQTRKEKDEQLATQLVAAKRELEALRSVSDRSLCSSLPAVTCGL